MLCSYKFRLYPYPDQEEKLLEHLETCRRLWNGCLAQRKESWEEERTFVGKNQQKHQITVCKKDNKYLADLHVHVAQDVVMRLDKAYKAFFKRVARYPKFKKYGCYSSFTYLAAYNGSVRLGVSRKNTKIYLSKVGYVPVVVHREPPEGVNKRCTVKREGAKWYIILEYDVPGPYPDPVPIMSVVGGDLGIVSTLALSDGTMYEPSAPLQHREKRIKHLQRAVSRKKKGSKNRVKAVMRLNKEHQKIASIRRDSNHKVSKKVVDAYDLITLEDLRILDMVKDHYFAKAILDRGWGQLIWYIQYKALRQGKTVVLVPPQYTSKICSVCGHVKDMPLRLRVYKCPVCGNTIDRDVNAARNILARGLSQVGRGTANLMPVEGGVQFGWSTILAQPPCEAGTTSGGG